MLRSRLNFTAALLPLLALAAYGSDAETSASAGSNSFRRDGTASSTARYAGDLGFARTQSRSGSVSTARGVAVGVDQNGISLSVSQAIAPRLGPALGVNFNMSIGRDGQVSGSTGTVVADSPLYRAVSAGGATSTNHGQPSSMSYATGRTDPYGTVGATTRSYGSESVRSTPVRREAPRLFVSRNPARSSVTSQRGVRAVRTVFRGR